MATCQLLLGDECREEYVAPIERIAEQRVGGESTGDRRRGASTLSAGERQSFGDAQCNAEPIGVGASQHFAGRDPGRMA
jgi:hypothetical protein